MKWNPPSERAQFWIAAPITLPLTAMMLPFIALAAGSFHLSEWIGRRFGPSFEWSQWYAWRPTRINDWFDDENEGRWVWFETIWRRRYGSQIETRYKEPIA